MSENQSSYFTLFVKWIIALAILVGFMWVVFIFYNYVFDYFLSFSTKWTSFWHILFWIGAGSVMVLLITTIGVAISSLAYILVNNSEFYLGLFSLCYLAMIGVCVYLAWTGSFNWIVYKYTDTNKVMYTLFMLANIRIPLAILKNTDSKISI